MVDEVCENAHLKGLPRHNDEGDQILDGGTLPMAESARVTIEVAGATATIFAEPKQFRTGSHGFYGQGKVKTTDGRRFQVSINIVEIGSKDMREN